MTKKWYIPGKIAIAIFFLVLGNLLIAVQSAEIESLPYLGFDGAFYRADELNKTLYLEPLPVIEINGNYYRADETNKTLYPIEIINKLNQTERYATNINETDESLQEKLASMGADKGDIIFGGNGKGIAPANTGHVGILISENGELKVREANLGVRVRTISIEDFINQKDYETVHIYRVKVASPDQRHAAAKKALDYNGDYWLPAGIWDDNLWYCSKLVWRAYADSSNIYIGSDCKKSWPCVDVSPCDIIKNRDKVEFLGAIRAGPFDCGNRYCGC